MGAQHVGACSLFGQSLQEATLENRVSVLFVYFSHIRLIEYDHWEQFESIQRLPQIHPLIHLKG
jgi:hypothetical protein